MHAQPLICVADVKASSAFYGALLGNGVAVWFGSEDLDARELWLRDLDGYLVVLAQWPSGGV